ncbi:hypothetical protein P305_11290 [Xylella fastidiosa subsp. fastidiosa Mus-1]|nr:hypothetical protein P303_05000 [Xylella fastidiosa MUL0034]KAF0570257.1 hypothetical protein P305_11290 [Xylella fastidiosa subsp. fastidiosa Mus-1]
MTIMAWDFLLIVVVTLVKVVLTDGYLRFLSRFKTVHRKVDGAI